MGFVVGSMRFRFEVRGEGAVMETGRMLRYLDKMNKFPE